MASTAPTAEEDENQVEPARRKVVNLPLRLPPATHDALRQIAFDRRISIHALLLEGVAEVLRKHGS